MKKYSAFTVAALAFLSWSSQSQAAQIIDISAATSAGTTVSLGAGTYSLDFIGQADGGAYNAWNAWAIVTGCDANGANCTKGYRTTFSLDFGHGTGQFDRTDGIYFSRWSSANDNLLYATDLLALQNVGSSVLMSYSYAPATWTTSPLPVQFTLNSAQDVNFFIPDSFYRDNLGGISLSLTPASTSPVPEPMTWALLLTGFGLVGWSMRSRKSPALAIRAAA